MGVHCEAFPIQRPGRRLMSEYLENNPGVLNRFTQFIHDHATYIRRRL
jgi:hypothetical protein